ncbi:hypothetical protein [Pseudoxanthomonas wuyuanensis]|uniref:hypothetical protein n=1 Tax=Pseudoxanthomonas wuyuanensis TaxID=1073196 RepID=UPI001389D235|nr:hypothetical protein [Pseudoxanthomonas wuyuanensis]
MAYFIGIVEAAGCLPAHPLRLPASHRSVGAGRTPASGGWRTPAAALRPVRP